MTDEQRKRIHDITYSTDDRMELAERIVALEEEIDKQKFKFEVLKAHGIEIVDAVGGGHEIYDTRTREVDRLEYENDKLRQLIRDYDKCLDTALYLAGKAGYPYMPDRHLFESLRPRMRELGIEAD